MPINNRVGSYSEASFNRESALYTVTFKPTATPTIQDQDEAIVSGVTRTSAGLYVLALRGRYNRVRPVGAPNVEDTPVGDKWTANVVGVIDGLTVANTLTVEIINEAGAAADPGTLCDVSFRIIASTGT